MKIKCWTKIALLSLLLASFSQSFGQIFSFPVDSPEINYESEGFYYGLPSHTIRINVKIKKTDQYKGKYSDYATKLLGITEVINKDATSYQIEDISITTLAEIDSSQIYYAQFPSKFSDDRSFMVEFTDMGMLSGIQLIRKEVEKPNYISDVPFRDLLKPVLIEKVDTIIRRVSIDTTIIEEKVLKRSISEKSIEQQAREVADLIYRIEDSKFSLITGYQEVNYSKESLQYMLNKLNAMEREYIAFFKGSVLVSEIDYTYYFKPEGKPQSSLNTLFRFSASDGLVGIDRKSGDAVNISIVPDNFFEKARGIEKKRLNAKRKGKGIFYRIPESVNIRIMTGDKVLASERSLISQMGILSFLPYNNLTKAYFSESGSLKSIFLED
jgi:hypothetical protein